MENISLRTKILLAGCAALVYGAGLSVTVMDIDAAQYASMSCQIAASRHFWTSLLQPAGYLDKPPLLFFLSAVSFKVLGVSTVSYKIPSFLMMLLGFYATYRLGALLYNRRIGVLAAAVLCSCEGIIFFTNDVRTDAILTGTVVFSVWQIAEFIETGRAAFFLGGTFGVALAMLAKGPIGLMVPVLAVGSYVAGKRRFRMFLKWYWPVGGLIVLFLLMPMLWGLYSQYGWRGIRFYFWTQSFGRITGQSSWRDTSGYFYFVHTFLWAFLPWMLLAYYSIGDHAVRAIKNRFDPANANDLLLLGGTVFPFVALSCSHYKLPHYIFVIFPLAAILTAKTMCELIDAPHEKKAYRIFLHTQQVCCILMWVFALVCMTVFFPCKNPVVWLLAVTACAATFRFSSKKRSPFARLVLPSLWAIFGMNIVVNLHLFPQLMSFQGGSNAATSIRRNHVPLDRVFGYRAQDHSIEFYTRRTIPLLDSIQTRDTLRSQDVWIYTGRDGYRSIREMGFLPAVVDSFPDFHVSKVTMKFLFFKTRSAMLGWQYILHNIREEKKSAGNKNTLDNTTHSS
jgi:4-amino-4-deoxy-L-arabinose transferase-like glycosyltransferase